MNKKEFLKLINFVASKGGIIYYEELLEELKIINVISAKLK